MKKTITPVILMLIIISCTKSIIEPETVTSATNENSTSAVLEDSVLYKNAFTNNSQDWKILGDAQGSSIEPTHSSTGGNPGGYISAKDDVAGGVWYFSAPLKFLENMKDRYGKILKFQLKQSGTNSQFDSRDVIIEGNGLLLHYNTANNPNTTWTKYAVPLSASKWLKDDSTIPTRAEMKGVLNNITKLWIRGEYIQGADVGSLDNVAIVERLEE